MKLLLDTHIFLWFISGDKRLPEAVRDNIRDLDNEVYLSVVSLMKHRLTIVAADDMICHYPVPILNRG